MPLTPSPTELSTSITDAVLAVECIGIMAFFRQNAAVHPQKILLWTWVFGCLAFASLLGFVVHGFVLPTCADNILWKILYLSLGLMMALFLVGVVFDWQGRNRARYVLPWSIGAGLIFYGWTEIAQGSFFVFVIYEAGVMATALSVYAGLAVFRRQKGAGIIALAVFLNLAAAGIQASNCRLTVFWPLDHNGIFHLVQMAAIAALGLGIRLGTST